MLGLKLEGALHWEVGGPILVLQEFMGGRNSRRRLHTNTKSRGLHNV